MTATLFALDDLICGKVQARAHDGEYHWELQCHRPLGHDGPCRVLSWVEVPA